MTDKNRKYVAELRKQDGAGLQADLIKLRREQFSLRMQAASGQAVKSSDFGKAKKNIARVKTVMAEKARAGARK
jgi:large subunit ribosomal protein L29